MKTLRFFGYLNFHIQISWYPLASKLSPSNIIQRFRKTCSLTVHHVSNVILLEEHPLFCTHLNFTMGYKSHFWRLKSNCWLVRITVTISVSVLCPIPVFAAYRGAPPVSSCFAFNCFTINHMCCKCLVLTNLYSYHKWAISSYINYKSTFLLVKLPCLWLNHHFCWLQQHFSPTLPTQSPLMGHITTAQGVSLHLRFAVPGGRQRRATRGGGSGGGGRGAGLPLQWEWSRLEWDGWKRMGVKLLLPKWINILV